MEYLALRPTWMYKLRHGTPPEPKQQIKRHKVRDSEGQGDWDGTWAHQSTGQLVISLMTEMKSQGVWDRERAWTELIKTQNVGGRWLRDQEDPRATFEDMWARAVQHPPCLSYEQAQVGVLSTIETMPGARLCDVRKAVHFNRGHLDSILAAFITDGTLVEVREMSGARCVARRFWLRSTEPVVKLARKATACLSLALLGLGHRTTEGSRSFHQLVTNKKLKAFGIMRRRKAGRARRVLGQPPPNDSEVGQNLLHLLDGSDLSATAPRGFGDTPERAQAQRLQALIAPIFEPPVDLSALALIADAPGLSSRWISPGPRRAHEARSGPPVGEGWSRPLRGLQGRLDHGSAQAGARPLVTEGPKLADAELVPSSLAGNPAPLTA